MKKQITESEWMESVDSYSMLKPCRRVIRKSPRKGRLFAVACCYRIWHLLGDERSRTAVELAAQYADGRITGYQLGAAEKAAELAHSDAFQVKGKVGVSAEWAAQFAASSDAWFAASRASNFAYVAAGDGLELGPEHTAQSHLLRCIFGPMAFRSVLLDDSWPEANNGKVLDLAQSIYADQDFDRLSVLADALEEAGCEDSDILAHCLHPGPHVRGCWVVDLLLGKE